MVKHSPGLRHPPPVARAVPSSPSAKSKAKQQDETTQRVLDRYLLPKLDKSQDEPKPGQVFTVVKGLDNECLLANLSETLSSADAMANELAFDLEGSRRHLALGIQPSPLWERACSR